MTLSKIPRELPSLEEPHYAALSSNFTNCGELEERTRGMAFEPLFSVEAYD